MPDPLQDIRGHYVTAVLVAIETQPLIDRHLVAEVLRSLADSYASNDRAETPAFKYADIIARIYKGELK